MSKWQKLSNRKLQRQLPKKPSAAVAVSRPTTEMPPEPGIAVNKD
jgi:hypothetical protein